MENISWITYETLWKDWEPRRWIPGLSLLTLPWIKPFLALMGLPKDIVLQSQIWEQIYTQAVREYDEIMKPLWKLGGDDHTLAERKVTQTVISQALCQLASKLGKNTAVELERWVRRHLLSYEIETAMRSWMFVLREACWPADNSPQHIPVPSCLLQLIPEIQELVYDGIDASDYILTHMKPWPTTEEEEETRFIWTSDTQLVSQVITQELVIRSLKIIAKTLNEQECKNVLFWALSQAEAISVTSPENLKGDKYLRVEPPYFDFPSILDFPIPDEPIINTNL